MTANDSSISEFLSETKIMTVIIFAGIVGNKFLPIKTK